MTDESPEPKAPKSALEFLVQTHHQPLYRVAELLIERDDEQRALGKELERQELQEHGVAWLIAQAKTDYTSTSCVEQVVEQLAFVFTGLKSADGPTMNETVRLSATQLIRSFIDAFYYPRELQPEEKSKKPMEQSSEPMALKEDSGPSAEIEDVDLPPMISSVDQVFGYLSRVRQLTPDPLQSEVSEMISLVEQWARQIVMRVTLLKKARSRAPLQGLTVTGWRAAAKELWGLLDNIDTLGDQIKPSDLNKGSWREYFDAVESLHQRRHALLVTDGQTLTPAMLGQRQGEGDSAAPRHEMVRPRVGEAKRMLDGLLRDTKQLPKIFSTDLFDAVSDRNDAHRRAIQLLLAEYIERRG